ncbi:hypothetical protein [Bradyrhizobium daqingense]|nr:hypothetical protein [Bradyrhizobium daqingense]
MRLTRLLVGRLCFKLSLRLAMAGAIISGLDATRPAFPLHHY